MIEAFWAQHKGGVTRQYPGAVTSWQAHHKIPNCWLIRDLNSCMSITILSDDIIRVRMAPNGTFLDDFSYGLQHYDHKLTKRPSVSETEESIVWTTATIQLFLGKRDFRIKFTDLEGTVLCEDHEGLSWEENVAFGGYTVFSGKTYRNTEYYYGLGDKACDLSLNRKQFTLWSTDAYAFERGTDPLYRNIPFYVSLFDSRSYGIWYDNTHKSYFDFGVHDPEQVSFVAEGGELQYYFIAGPHMMDVVKRYSNLTGTAPMPPLWALGYHQCRWSYYPDSKLKELAREFRERKIPCDALYLDIDYMDGYRCFTWDKEKFPDPKGLTTELKEQGFQTVVIVDPGIKIDPDYPVFTEGRDKGYFCRRGDDYFMEGPVWPGRCQFPDFTNPEVREWWGRQFQSLLDEGVAGIWTDMNEPSVFGMGTFPNDVRHYYEGYRGSHRKAHNVYGMQMARATFEGLQKLLKNKRPFVITRSTYSGGQRYAAAWTGDNVGSWDHLRLACVQVQRMSMSGYSFVGSDIGGFTGNADAELFVRWMQLGAFSPFMRAHSSGDTREREPWSYGPEAEAIIKQYIELRYKLLPYLYSVFWENHRYGFPMIRPVVMVEQQEANNAWRQDEFTLGDKMLICPVLDPGVQSRIVYLPKGEWYHYWTRERYEGPRENQVPAPLGEMPIFVRAGAVIPEYPVWQYTNEFPIEEMILNVYHANYTVNSFMYEDHGDTRAYEQDIYTEKKFVMDGHPDGLTLTQSMEGLYTPRYELYRFRIIGLPRKMTHIMVDGKLLTEYTWDDERKELEFVVFKSFKKFTVAEE